MNICFAVDNDLAAVIRLNSRLKTEGG